MTQFKSLVGAAFVISSMTFAQVSLKVSQPQSGGTYNSPVPVYASATSPKGISGWDVYLDSNLVLQNHNTSGTLDSSITAAVGNHTVVIKAWDNGGNQADATETISVVPGPSVTLIAPTSGATVSTTFTLEASCSSPATITGWEVYIDSQDPPYYKNTQNSSSLDIPVTTTAGAHSINVKCWDVNGVYGQVNFNITAESTTPSVQMVQPSAGATVNSPFTLQANCSSTDYPISGWDVYLDSQTPPYYQNTSSVSSIDIPVTASSGQHNLVVKCWNTDGQYGQADFDVTVQTGGLIPTPPASAQAFLNIDDKSGWQNCATSACNPVPPSSFTFTQNYSATSLDGNAINASATGPAYWGILFYNHLGAQDTASNFEVEWNYQVNSGASPQALEFDFPVWISQNSFYFGSQCVNGASWQFWIPSGTNRGWNDLGVACPTITTAVWHKLRWYGTIDHAANTYTYVAIEVDGQQYPINITVPAGSISYPDNFTTQFQMDGNGTGASYHEFVDEMNAWTW